MTGGWRPATFPAEFAGLHGGPVPGLIRGPFGIARWAGRRHVFLLPVGCSIADFGSVETAQQFVAAIDGLTDWHSPTPAADPRVLRAVEEARGLAGAAPLAAAA
jgi:hypothetical protein